MAQQDTGLGWNAKEEWLVNTTGTIAEIHTIGGPDFPGQPIPKNIYSTTDVIAGGMLICHISDPNTQAWYSNLDFYVGAETADVVTYYVTGYVFKVVIASPVNGAVVRFAAKNPVSGRVETEFAITCNIYNTSSGLYWNYADFTSGSTSQFNIPGFPGYLEGLPHILTINTNFDKINAGFAVACVAKWKTTNGTLLESPILISTETDFVDMQTTATGINFAKLNVLYQGRKFYMSFYDRPYDGNLVTNIPVVDLSDSESPTFTLEALFRYIAKNDCANIQITIVPDPYQEGEGSGEGGTDGEDDEEDNVDFTDPPSTSIGATGLLTIFCPTLGQLQSLGAYMWGSFDVDNWRKIIANPMDAILGLHTIPIPAVTTGTKAVKVAGIDTTIDMSYTTVRYIPRSMGTCEIPKKWGAYLDYSPYTKISIFLPFIGFKELDADDIMGRTIALQYMIDILTGACVAELKCGDTILYSWSGNCANEVPISGSDWRGAIASAIGIAATVAGTALVTGGATAPMAASMVASVGANSLNLKPTVNRSGAISGSAGYMGQKRPYIIRSIPNLVIPADQNKFIGYPSFVTASLGSLTGYNEIASVHLEGIPATGNELSEIETLLKGGVIF